MPPKTPGSKSVGSRSGLSSPKLWPTLSSQGTETGPVAKSVDYNTHSSVTMCNTDEDVDDSKSQHSLST